MQPFWGILPDALEKAAIAAATQPCILFGSSRSFLLLWVGVLVFELLLWPAGFVWEAFPPHPPTYLGCPPVSL